MTSPHTKCQSPYCQNRTSKGFCKKQACISYRNFIDYCSKYCPPPTILAKKRLKISKSSTRKRALGSHASLKDAISQKDEITKYKEAWKPQPNKESAPNTVSQIPQIKRLASKSKAKRISLDKYKKAVTRQNSPVPPAKVVETESYIIPKKRKIDEDSAIRQPGKKNNSLTSSSSVNAELPQDISKKKTKVDIPKQARAFVGYKYIQLPSEKAKAKPSHNRSTPNYSNTNQLQQPATLERIDAGDRSLLNPEYTQERRSQPIFDSTTSASKQAEPYISEPFRDPRRSKDRQSKNYRQDRDPKFGNEEWQSHRNFAGSSSRPRMNSNEFHNNQPRESNSNVIPTHIVEFIKKICKENEGVEVSFIKTELKRHYPEYLTCSDAEILKLMMMFLSISPTEAESKNNDIDVETGMWIPDEPSENTTMESLEGQLETQLDKQPSFNVPVAEEIIEGIKESPGLEDMLDFPEDEKKRLVMNLTKKVIDMVKVVNNVTTKPRKYQWYEKLYSRVANLGDPKIEIAVHGRKGTIKINGKLLCTQSHVSSTTEVQKGVLLDILRIAEGWEYVLKKASKVKSPNFENIISDIDSDNRITVTNYNFENEDEDIEFVYCLGGIIIGKATGSTKSKAKRNAGLIAMKFVQDCSLMYDMGDFKNQKKDQRNSNHRNEQSGSNHRDSRRYYENKIDSSERHGRNDNGRSRDNHSMDRQGKSRHEGDRYDRDRSDRNRFDRERYGRDHDDKNRYDRDRYHRERYHRSRSRERSDKESQRVNSGLNTARSPEISQGARVPYKSKENCTKKNTSTSQVMVNREAKKNVNIDASKNHISSSTNFTKTSHINSIENKSEREPQKTNTTAKGSSSPKQSSEINQKPESQNSLNSESLNTASLRLERNSSQSNTKKTTTVQPTSNSGVSAVRPAPISRISFGNSGSGTCFACDLMQQRKMNKSIKCLSCKRKENSSNN